MHTLEIGGDIRCVDHEDTPRQCAGNEGGDGKENGGKHGGGVPGGIGGVIQTVGEMRRGQRIATGTLLQGAGTLILNGICRCMRCVT